MKTLSRLSLSVALVGAALSFAPLAANAVPLNFTSGAVAAPASASVEKVAWVCGLYRCWHRPGPAFWRPAPAYGFYYGRPQFYGRPHYWHHPHYGW